MKTGSFSILLLLAVQIQQTDAFLLCFLFGWLGGLFSGPVNVFLNGNVAGKTVSTGYPAPYTDFRLDRFDRLQFQGCTVTFGGNFTFVSTTSPIGDEKGYFQVQGTLDLPGFLFGGFKICIEGLEVTTLEFDNSPGDVIETWTRNYINDQFDDPECFEKEE